MYLLTQQTSHHVAGPRRCCERDGVVPRKKQSCHASLTSSRQRRILLSWKRSWSASSRSADSRCFSFCFRAAPTAASETEAVKPRGGARPKASSGGQRGSASAGAVLAATAAAASRATAVRRGAASSALAQPESKTAASTVQRCRAQPGRILCRRLARGALLQGCMTALTTTLRSAVRRPPPCFTVLSQAYKRPLRPRQPVAPASRAFGIAAIFAFHTLLCSRPNLRR